MRDEGGRSGGYLPMEWSPTLLLGGGSRTGGGHGQEGICCRGGAMVRERSRGREGERGGREKGAYRCGRGVRRPAATSAQRGWRREREGVSEWREREWSGVWSERRERRE